jgi:hypothetical protein
MAQAADENYTVAGAHLDSLGVGMIARAGNAFRFGPL